MTNTIQHVTSVLNAVDPVAKFTEVCEHFVASPERNASEQHDLHAWSLDRIKDLCGANSFSEAYKNDDFRIVLAFGFLGYAHSPVAIPPLRRSMPVPEPVAAIEPDFFPVLLKAIKSRAASSKSFNADLKAAEERVKDLVGKLSGKVPSGVAAAQNQGIGDIVNALAVALCVIAAIVGWGKKKSK